MNRQFASIYKKELTDTLRDKRAMLAILYFVVGSPLIMLVLFLVISMDKEERGTKLLISGIDQAPGLVAFVQKRGIEVENYTLDGETPDSLPEKTDGILVVPENYAEALAEGSPVRLTLFTDEGSKDSLQRSREIQVAVQSFSGYLASIRLTTRGVPATLMQPYDLAKVDISEYSFLGRFMSEFFLLLVIFAPFAAGMSVAIDVLAGERERNSLQPLLALPVSATTLALSKWAVVCTFGIAATIATAIILFLELHVLPSTLIAFDVNTEPMTLLLLVLQLVPLAMFAGALQMACSIMAKSFREAQTLLSIVMMVPFFAVYIKIFLDDKTPEFVRYLPILADMESASALLFRGGLSATHYLTALAVAAVGIVAALTLTIRRLDSERLLDSN